MSIRLIAVNPEQSRGHVYAVVRAYNGDTLIYADRLALDRVEDRRTFAREVCSLRPETDSGFVERELLRFFDEASPADGMAKCFPVPSQPHQSAPRPRKARFATRWEFPR